MQHRPFVATAPPPLTIPESPFLATKARGEVYNDMFQQQIEHERQMEAQSLGTFERPPPVEGRRRGICVNERTIVVTNEHATVTRNSGRSGVVRQPLTIPMSPALHTAARGSVSPSMHYGGENVSPANHAAPRADWSGKLTIPQTPTLLTELRNNKQ